MSGAGDRTGTTSIVPTGRAEGGVRDRAARDAVGY
jgi:hypothetical protein